ncbi:MAG TPA: selenide, water dikinase SelD [Thermoleophilaceae bacterium]|nr:selenide, water dikinase SelD [Thermoleophilaceae bacterium]
MHSPERTTLSPPRLTTFSHGAGCACKLPASELQALLAELPVTSDVTDDAAVLELAHDLALVSTTDFFTPIVDDPYDFGRIAAANALSDIYAMGATPVLALSLVAWPLEALGRDTLREVLRGGADAAAEAGVPIAGGHSIDDPEPKFGLAVTGRVHPERVVRNSGGRAGDELYLTKAVGGGVASTALKRGRADDSLVAAATEVMCTLNRDAAAGAVDAGVTAMTDVTGFGLLGHLRELAAASGVAAEVDAASVPAIPGVLELLRGEDPPISGGSRRNRGWVEEVVDWGAGVPEERRWLLCDAMTSGGLLIAVPPDGAARAPGVRIGRLVKGEPGRITVS